MATLIELAEASQVFKIDPVLGSRQQEERLIYVLPHLRQWLEEALPALESTWNIEQRPIEQLDALFYTFCSGETLTYGWQFKPLVHIRNGIWELKTADLRMFGWFYAKDCFVATDAELSDTVKRLHMYGPFRDQAVRRRDALDLDEPKFIQGDDPNDVISAYDYPE